MARAVDVTHFTMYPVLPSAGQFMAQIRAERVDEKTVIEACRFKKKFALPCERCDGSGQCPACVYEGVSYPAEKCWCKDGVEHSFLEILSDEEKSLCAAWFESNRESLTIRADSHIGPDYRRCAYCGHLAMGNRPMISLRARPSGYSDDDYICWRCERGTEKRILRNKAMFSPAPRQALVDIAHIEVAINQLIRFSQETVNVHHEHT